MGSCRPGTLLGKPHRSGCTISHCVDCLQAIAGNTRGHGLCSRKADAFAREFYAPVDTQKKRPTGGAACSADCLTELLAPVTVLCSANAGL